MNNISVIIFDVDGVIFKSYDENGNFSWSSNIAQDLGLTSQHLALIFSEKWTDIIRGKMSLIEHLEVVFKNELFLKVSISIKDYIQYWLSKDHNINSEILKLIENIKIPCYLGTNQEEIRTTHILDAVGSHFKGCFTSYEFGFIKPEQEFFQYIENTLEIFPNKILLIDDTKNNVESAKQRGWNVYHYQSDIDNLKKFLLKNKIICGIMND